MSTSEAHDRVERVSQELEAEIKQLIVGVLRLKQVEAASIDADAPLFHDGLGLDSLDAIQLGVALQRTYGVVLGPDDAETQRQMESVRTIAELVRSRGRSGVGP